MDNHKITDDTKTYLPGILLPVPSEKIQKANQRFTHLCGNQSKSPYVRYLTRRLKYVTLKSKVRCTKMAHGHLLSKYYTR